MTRACTIGVGAEVVIRCAGVMRALLLAIPVSLALIDEPVVDLLQIQVAEPLQV